MGIDVVEASIEEETPKIDTIGSPAKSEYEDHKPSHDQLNDVKEEKDSVPLQNVSNQNTKNSPLKQLKCPECDLVCLRVHPHRINSFSLLDLHDFKHF